MAVKAGLKCFRTNSKGWLFGRRNNSTLSVTNNKFTTKNAEKAPRLNPTTSSPANFCVSSPKRLLVIPLQKSSHTFPTHFDCDNHVINFTDVKKYGVFDTGQWQLTVSTPVGTVGAFDRRNPQNPRDFFLGPTYSCVTHRISGNRLFQITNLMHNSFIFQQYICYTTLLNMFRAARCSSSGKQIVSPQPLVSSPSVSSRAVCRWRADRSPLSTRILYGCLQRVTIPEAVVIQFVLLRMSSVLLETC